MKKVVKLGILAGIVCASIAAYKAWKRVNIELDFSDID